jgi:putative hydrolase of the HAD superfamily
VDRVVLWDFEGTLAYRAGLWSGCMAETLGVYEPQLEASAEDLEPFLSGGFPWDDPETPHPELSTVEAWWRPVEGVLAHAYEEVGLDPRRARELARATRSRYLDCAGWSLFDDSLSVLRALRDAGWHHAVVSNHVPELPVLVDELGLGDLVDVVLTSAATGYEKPHPGAFAIALARCGWPDEVWMVGDSVVTDVAGAEAVGIAAILVRAESANVKRRAETLDGARAIVIAEPVRRGRADGVRGRHDACWHVFC